MGAIYNGNTRTTPINNLPPELLCHIFKFYDPKDTYENFMLVCRAWRDIIISTVSFWQQFSESMICLPQQSHRRLAICQKYSKNTINSLGICLGSNETFDNDFLTTSFPSLESFKLSMIGGSSRNTNLLYSFMKCHSNLVRLELDFITTPLDFESILVLFPNLEYLGMRLTTRVEENQVTLRSKDTMYHPLKELRVQSINARWIPLKSSYLSNLESLTLDESFLDFLKAYQQPSDFKNIDTITFPKLRSFTMINRKYWEGIESMKKLHLPELEELHLRSSVPTHHELLDKKFLTLLSHLSEATLENLKILRLDKLPCIPKDLVRLIPDLREFHIRGTMDKGEIFSLISKWSNLKVLGVQIPVISDDFTVGLEKVLPPQLQILKLAADSVPFPRKIPAASVAQLVKSRLTASHQNNQHVCKIKSLTVNILDDDIESIEWIKENVPIFYIDPLSDRIRMLG